VVKRPEREADHLPPSNAEIKDAWSYTFTPMRDLMAWCLVKHRDKFTSYLPYRNNTVTPYPTATDTERVT